MRQYRKSHKVIDIFSKQTPLSSHLPLYIIHSITALIHLDLFPFIHSPIEQEGVF